MAAFKTLRSKSIVVLVNTKEQGSYSSLPEPVQKALNDPAVGRVIPRLVVFDAAAEQHLGSMSYEEIKGNNFRAIKKSIAEYEPPKAPEPWDGTFEDAEFADWTSAKGTKMRAKPVKFVGGKLTLLNEAGRQLVVAPAQLDDESRARVEALVAAAEAVPE